QVPSDFSLPHLSLGRGDEWLVTLPFIPRFRNAKKRFAVHWIMFRWKLAFALAVGLGCLRGQEPPTFGTTVVDLSGLEGHVFFLDARTQKLPDFSRLHPVGSVYTPTLNVWPQSFSEGFPNVTDRFEWFGIQYTGKFWVETPGEYRFSLLSD